LAAGRPALKNKLLAGISANKGSNYMCLKGKLDYFRAELEDVGVDKRGLV
jgi:hypothetical protein